MLNLGGNGSFVASAPRTVLPFVEGTIQLFGLCPLDINYEVAEEEGGSRSRARRWSKRINSTTSSWAMTMVGSTLIKCTKVPYRELIMGDEIEWFNYWPLLAVRTESE